MEKMKIELENTITETQKLILENRTEWAPRYEGYAQKILANKDSIERNRKKCKESSNLKFYISTTNAKNAHTDLILDVRYFGQSIATLEMTKNDVTISTKGKDEKNFDHFGCNIKLERADWRGKEAKAFRAFFRNNENPRNNTKKRNDEHKIESLLLSEFSKKGSKDKQILFIQPVTFFGIRYEMPSPIKASDLNNPAQYANHYGGGIDILARTGKGRYNTHLAVIEVKDENKSNEPPLSALKQAIKYAVFIRELLRSDCGAGWYKIFGFKGKRPKTLKIRVACAMPDNNLDTSFAGMTIPVDNDVIECHYIYFKYDEQQLSDFQTSLKQ